MRDVFGEAKQRLAREMDSHSALPNEPIAADPWVISSLLQKSIRRGETEIAQRAALALHRNDRPVQTLTRRSRLASSTTTKERGG
jgi:hypothetical protein